MRTYEKLMITGGTGFVGKHLLSVCKENFSFGIRVAGRTRPDFPCEFFDVGRHDAKTDWRSALAGIDVVIHLAGKSNANSAGSENQRQEYKEVNVNATVNLAYQAALAGVKRFVYLSSVKAVGEETFGCQSFSVNTPEKPISLYGQSKLAAEEKLIELTKKFQMEVVIIRSPLVYGPGVKGNFDKLIRLIDLEVPLPLKSIRNKRSFVGIDNLTDFILLCSWHPAAANNVFFVSDDDDLSTPELIVALGRVTGKPVRLFNLPLPLLSSLTSLVGKRNISSSLTSSLQIDLSHTKDKLSWEPPVSVHEALSRCFLLEKI